MSIRKALIPAAGTGTRMFPVTKYLKKEMLPVVDIDGVAKPVIQFNVEEATGSGIDDIAVVVPAGSENCFARYFSDCVPAAYAHRYPEIVDHLADLGRRITYITQEQQEGYGHAVFCARDWAGREPFVLLLGDHVFRSEIEQTCIQQLSRVWDVCHSSFSAVNRTRPEELAGFGTIAGTRDPAMHRLYRVSELKEKPSVDYARAHLRVEGIPEDEFLSFFGMHVFTPEIFDALGYNIENDIREKGEFQLTCAQELLRTNTEHYRAYEIQARRYDTGCPDEYRATIAAVGKE